MDRRRDAARPTEDTQQDIPPSGLIVLLSRLQNDIKVCTFAALPSFFYKNSFDGLLLEMWKQTFQKMPLDGDSHLIYTYREAVVKFKS